MPPKKCINAKKEKVMKIVDMKRKPTLKRPPAKNKIDVADILITKKLSPTKNVNPRKRSALSNKKAPPKEVIKLINKDPVVRRDKKDSTDTKTSKNKSPKKSSARVHEEHNLELANAVVSYQLAKHPSSPIKDSSTASVNAPKRGKKKQNPLFTEKDCSQDVKDAVDTKLNTRSPRKKKQNVTFEEALKPENEVARSRLTKHPSLKKDVSETSANAHKRRRKKILSPCRCTETVETPSPTKAIDSKRVRKKPDSDFSDMDVQVKKKTVKKMPVTDAKYTNEKKDKEVKVNKTSVQNKTIKKLVRRNKLKSPRKYPNCIVNNNVDLMRSKMLNEFDTMSWTRDISSSDTTTCASIFSSDFVRIDKKLPKLQLAKVDEMSASEVSSLFSSQSKSLNSVSTFPSERKATASKAQTFISSSSSISKSSQDKENNAGDFTKVNSILSRFINSFDVEVMDWIGPKIDENTSLSNNKFHNYFKVESEILNVLQNVENISAGKTVDQSHLNINVERDSPNNNINFFVEHDLANSNINSYVEHNSYNNDNIHLPFKYEDIQADNVNISGSNQDYVDKNDNTYNDDEDALSLYTESLVGVASSRRTSIASPPLKGPEFEEYIPQPTTNVSSPQKVTYQPTKIIRIVSDLNKTSGVCEKHNADSTSVREIGRNEYVFETPVVCDKVVYPNNVMTLPMKKSHAIQPSKPLQGLYSTVYKGVCFYNLISKCKRFNCNFPHENLDVEDARNNMSCLPNDLFAKEYMLTKGYPSLRQNYIVAFIEECIKRELTSLLLEMCIDYLKSLNVDSVLASQKTYVTECIMLYLNGVPLTTYAEFLNHQIEPQIALCDVFIRTIAVAQNFQQFKQIFINLADYMLNVNRVIHLKVATLIVERLCILPYDEALTKAFFKVIINTEVEVINCPLIERFEKRLQSESVGFHGHFLYVKNIIMNSLQKQSDPNAGTRISNSIEEKRSRTSPDTTNLDNSIKFAPVSTLNNSKQRETVVAENKAKSKTVSQTTNRQYGASSWIPQKSGHRSYGEWFNRPQDVSRPRGRGPRSYGWPRGFRGGRPQYRRHFEPLAPASRYPVPRRRFPLKHGYWDNQGEY